MIESRFAGYASTSMVELVAGTLRKARRRARRWVVAAVVFVLMLAAASTWIVVRAVTLQDAVMPGTTVADLDIGGLSRAEASAVIAGSIGSRLERLLTVRVGSRELTVTPADLYRLDLAATERAVFDAGRSSVLGRLGSLAAPFAADHQVEPVFVALPAGHDRLAARVARLTSRPVSATVELDGRQAIVTPAQEGSLVERAALVEEIRRVALAGSGGVTAVVTPSEPAVTTLEASRAALDAELIASAPVRVELRGEAAGKLGPETLAGLVRFREEAGALEAVLGQAALGRTLEPMGAGLLREPKNAGFRIEGKRALVVRAKPGTALDAKASAAAVSSAALSPRRSGGRVAAVGVTAVEAGFSTSDARALGIRRQLATFTTDMGVSSANRIHNVLLMGDYLDGTILKPGEVFSFNGTVGPRTAERGFLEGHMILGGLLVPSIGGGVCQVASTVFNAAFETGLPIKERHNHSFYISHYPMGRDATVSWGGPNLVFRNDLDKAILIKASGNSTTFTVSFYGTPQGRKVTSSTSTPTNYTSPTLQYAYDPSAPPGSVRTVAGGGSGFDVSVHRVVREEGKIIREDDFFSRYTPQNPTEVYGPGRTPPGPYFTIPSSA
jgi:vancomycin resistance protein YoaR